MNLLKVSFDLPISDSVMQFLLILVIILIVPIVFNKLKIPSLLGLIIAGTIVGPLGLNLMDRDSSFLLFGTAGLLFIMFLAGLDTDISEFKANSKKSAYFGILTFLIPFLMSFAAGYYAMGLPLLSAILIGGMIAPHTPITYPIVTKFDIQKNIAVSITLGGTLITNIVSFIIIVVVVGMSTGDVGPVFWIRLTISAIVFACIIIFLFPLVARWFFKKYQDNVSQFIFVLVMMFLGAFLADLAGIERIIGALFAGMTLNRLIPRTSPLMNRINFVANSIFIPFFLISVGMLVDFRSFYKDVDTLIAAALLTTSAILSKWLAAYFTQKKFKFSVDQRRVINGMSSAQAAATLAVVLIGYNIVTGVTETGEPIRLLNDSILNGTLIMILISCATAALQTQRGAKNIALQEASAPDSEQLEKVHEDSEEERILISISNLETVEELVHLSTMIKSQSNTNGLYGLNIITNNNYSAQEDKNAMKIFGRAIDVAAATDNPLHKLLRHDVNIVNGITNVIKENQITDLVLGIYQKKGISTAFIGNLNEGILAKSNVTTFIYKSSQPIATIKRHIIFVPIGAEMEIGFPFWLLKIWNIARNSGTKLVFYAAAGTLEYIKEVNDKFTIPCEFIEFTEWDDFLVLSREFGTNDNLIFILSRDNGITYHHYMTSLPHYLNKYFQSNSYILVYPQQVGIHNSTPRKIEHLRGTITSLFRKK